ISPWCRLRRASGLLVVTLPGSEGLQAGGGRSGIADPAHHYVAVEGVHPYVGAALAEDGDHFLLAIGVVPDAAVGDRDAALEPAQEGVDPEPHVVVGGQEE